MLDIINNVRAAHWCRPFRYSVLDVAPLESLSLITWKMILGGRTGLVAALPTSSMRHPKYKYSTWLMRLRFIIKYKGRKMHSSLKKPDKTSCACNGLCPLCLRSSGLQSQVKPEKPLMLRHLQHSASRGG